MERERLQRPDSANRPQDQLTGGTDTSSAPGLSVSRQLLQRSADLNLPEELHDSPGHTSNPRKYTVRPFDHDEDIATIYFKETNKTSLLTASEELDLGRQIEKGSMAKARQQEMQQKMMRGEPIDQEESAELVRDIEQGSRAEKILIESNLRLSASIAARYQGRGMDLSDLIQEGNMGLMKAVSRYDWKKGFRFSTYATWWIRQAITRAIVEKGRAIRLPVHIAETVNKLRYVQDNLTYGLGREPTVEELSASMNLPPEDINTLLRVSVRPVNLNISIGNDGENDEFEDLVSDETQQTENDAVTQQSKNELAEVIAEAKLTEREQRILTLRFGLDGGGSRPLEIVGKEFGLTRERIRQIEAKALRKLRSPSIRKKLEGMI